MYTKRLPLLIIILLLIMPASSAALQTPRPIVFIADEDGLWKGERSYDLYVINPDGSDLRRLTETDYSEDWPVLAPDGSRIAYHAGPLGGPMQLYVINVDGTNMRQLTDYPDGAKYPAWSPDGTKLAFGARRDGEWAIYVTDVDDPTTIWRLTPLTRWHNLPQWSPTGEHILFRTTAEGTYRSQIRVVNVADSTVIPMSDPNQNCHVPAWSPDGGTVAFVCVINEAREICANDVDGTNFRQITQTPHLAEMGVTWSPDGAQMIYSAQNRLAEWDLYVMDADGSKLRRVLQAPGWEIMPFWSADATQIFYYSDGGGAYAEQDLYVIDSEGGFPRRLTFFRSAVPYLGTQP